MAERLDLVKRTAAYLRQNSERKFTAREIAEWVVDTYPEECAAKAKRSRNKTQDITGQIANETTSNFDSLQKKWPRIKATEDRPRKFYWTALSDSEEVDREEEPPSDALQYEINAPKKPKEKDLYPKLIEFLKSELDIFGWRIDERKSKNSYGIGGNEWLYPDVVGMENLIQDWDSEIKDCVQQYVDRGTKRWSKLWSFEVKILINRSNVRRAFFQTVSNSSWANFGYLVVSEIGGGGKDAGTMKELRILASLHGIGVIKLDAENPPESQIMIPAKERTEINWDTANRLTRENKDFRKYIVAVRKFYQTGDNPVMRRERDSDED